MKGSFQEGQGLQREAPVSFAGKLSEQSGFAKNCEGKFSERLRFAKNHKGKFSERLRFAKNHKGKFSERLGFAKKYEGKVSERLGVHLQRIMTEIFLEVGGSFTKNNEGVYLQGIVKGSYQK